MRINSKLREEATYDGADAGEGLAIFLSQGGADVARYRFLVKAITSQGPYQVGEFYSSPPGATALPGRLSRMVAAAICPGAKSWAVEISAIPSPENVEETGDVILTSSRCYAQVGVTRVGERYVYHSGSANPGPTNFTVRAGMVVTGITAFGLGGGGSVVIAGGDTVTVPAGVGVGLAPGASIAPNSVIAFTSVDWVIELLESA